MISVWFQSIAAVSGPVKPYGISFSTYEILYIKNILPVCETMGEATQTSHIGSTSAIYVLEHSLDT